MPTIDENALKVSLEYTITDQSEFKVIQLNSSKTRLLECPYSIFGFHIINMGCNSIATLRKIGCKGEIIERPLAPQGVFGEEAGYTPLERGQFEVVFTEVPDEKKTKCEGKILPVEHVIFITKTLRQKA